MTQARSRDQFLCRVVANVPLCREHFRLVLAANAFPPTEPGQFVQVACREPGSDDDVRDGAELEWRGGARPRPGGGDLLAPLAVLRRPFSLAGRVDGAAGDAELHLIHRVVGVGTAWLASLKVGDAVDVLGPLGNRFTLPPADGLGLLVGGGVGIPPMLYLAEKFSGRRAVAFAGALSRDLLPLTIDGSKSGTRDDAVEPGPIVEEFSRHGVASVLTTDDGSLGFRGFVTQALEKYLDEQRPDVSKTIVYTCGPEPMMKRVASIADARGIECQVAVERAMACGMGTCQSCCIRVKKPDPGSVPLPGSAWCWRLACTDGPVFRGADLLW